MYRLCNDSYDSNFYNSRAHRILLVVVIVVGLIIFVGYMINKKKC